MDRALQERTIGAVVLVIFAVLVVPVFLDGPSDEDRIVSEPVTLPGQNDQERKTRTIVLNRDRNEPVPTPTKVVAAAPKTPQKKAVVAAEKSQPSPNRQAPAAKSDVSKPAEKSAPELATESATGMWAVQLGSFSSQENAERLAADLRSQGYAAFLSQLQTDSGKLHRVRIGPQKDRDGATSMAARLDSAGHAGQVVPHP
jgi:DedD protein